MTRSALSFTVKLRGPRLARAPGAGRLTVQLPLALIRLLGWRVGQRLKVLASEQGVTLSVRRVSSVWRAPVPRKRRAADQVRFQRRWQQALRALRRKPDKRRWSTVKKAKASL
ncbi:MAG: hypothetical protein Q7K57_01440 [Burkholderiaceae bacterium]|nr:hypothetical protein [Burkholderiaceae bacterium]